MATVKKALKYISITIVGLILTFILFLVGLKLFLPDNYIPNLVKGYANENLDANVNIEKIDLSVFKHFPYIAIELDNGYIVSNKTHSQTDSLLTFKNFALLFNPLQIIRGNIDISRILLKSPKIFASINTDNVANWDIIKQTDTTNTQEIGNEADSTSSLNLDINIKHITIKDRGIIVYRSMPDSLMTMLALNSVTIKGNFSNKFENLKLYNANFSKVTAMAVHKNSSARFTIDTLNIVSNQELVFDIVAHTRTNVRMAQAPLAKNVPFDITGQIRFNKEIKNQITFKDFKVSAAKIPITINGNLAFTPDSIYTNNLSANIEEFPFKDFLSYIPKKVFQNIDKVKTSAKLSMKSFIRGSYNIKTGALPNIDLSIKIPNSNIRIEGSKLGIKDMAANLNYYYRHTTPDSNRLEIKKLLMDGDGIRFNCTGYANNIATDPYINIQLNSFISLDTLANILPNNTGIIAHGELVANANIKGKRSHINLYNLKNANINGELMADNILVKIPNQNIFCSILNSKCTVSSKESGIVFTVDSINANIADSLVLLGKEIMVKGNNLTTKDNKSKGSAIHPFSGDAQASYIKINSIADSLNVNVRELKGSFKLLPLNGDYSLAHLKGEYSSKLIFIKQDVNILTITNSHINIDALQNTTQRKQRANYFGKKLNLEDDFTQQDYSFRLTNKGILDLLNGWSTSGTIKAERIRTATPFLPLRNSISGADIQFNLQRIKINSAKFTLGRSKFTADGSLSGIKNALTRGGKLKATLNINADTLNFNEILRALASADEYASKSDKYKDSLREVSNEEQMLDIIAQKEDSTQQIPLVIVPKNIEANFNLNIKHGLYASLILNGASGAIKSMDRKLHIQDFSAKTTVGEININAFYATPSKKDLAAGFDISLKDINIGSFIKLVPNIDTILPMLKSFEGIINSRIAATTQIDTNMNIIFSSLKGVARIKGDSLILMDSETFAQIAKTLKFKNREKNLVDSICVELLMDGNNIEVFPFMANMDRYKIAISGSQNIDMNFKYHFSVIKSPIPIRFGVNVFGNLDNFDFKIGKALYKNTNLPVYTHVIDSTTINLRNYINNILHKGVDAALQKGAYTKRIKDLASKETININNIQALSEEEVKELNK